MDKGYEIQVLIHADENGYWASVAQLPGVFAAGSTREELIEALEEAIQMYLDETGIPVVMEQVQIESFNLKGDGLVPA